MVNGESLQVNGRVDPVKMLSQGAIGRALGLAPATITKLKGQGMPVDSVESARAWRTARQNIAARKPETKSLPAVGVLTRSDCDPSGDDVRREVLRANEVRFDGGDLAEDHQAARTRREISEANQSEMAEAKMRHDQILIAAVQTAMSMDYAITRDSLLQMPARLAPLLAAEADPAAIQTMLHAELHQALLTLSGAAARMPDITGAFD